MEPTYWKGMTSSNQQQQKSIQNYRSEDGRCESSKTSSIGKYIWNDAMWNQIEGRIPIWQHSQKHRHLYIYTIFIIGIFHTLFLKLAIPVTRKFKVFMEFHISTLGNNWLQYKSLRVMVIQVNSCMFSVTIFHFWLWCSFWEKIELH